MLQVIYEMLGIPFSDYQMLSNNVAVRSRCDASSHMQAETGHMHEPCTHKGSCAQKSWGPACCITRRAADLWITHKKHAFRPPHFAPTLPNPAAPLWHVFISI